MSSCKDCSCTPDKCDPKRTQKKCNDTVGTHDPMRRDTGNPDEGPQAGPLDRQIRELAYELFRLDNTGMANSERFKKLKAELDDLVDKRKNMGKGYISAGSVSSGE